MVDALSAEELDVLPFGAIQLDHAGRVLRYNATEARLARVPQAEAVGRNFFTDVAPCAKVREFGGEFRRGVEQRQLDATFRFHFPFAHGPRDVVVRLISSRRTDSVWVFVSDPLGEAPAETP